MNINLKLIENIRDSKSQLLLVTKYFDSAQTQHLFDTYCEILGERVYGVGENRIKIIKNKKLLVQPIFIGNIQLRDLSDIIDSCSELMSLDSLKHAKKINDLVFDVYPVWVQINVSEEPQKGGVLPDELPEFLEALSALKHLTIRGFMTLGAGNFNEEEKRKEFQKLIYLRDLYLPEGLTSAGTSRDFEIALKLGVDLVRIGGHLIV